MAVTVAQDDSPPRELTWEEVQEALRGDAKPLPDICRLYEAIFCSKTACPTKADAVAELVAALQRRATDGCPYFTSVLLRHECCYVLGQVGADCEDEEGRRQAYTGLMEVLADEAEDEVTRHEAAEGIAAVYMAAHPEAARGGEAAAGLISSDLYRTLQHYASAGDGRGPLAETCHLATEGMRRRGAARMCACQYASHDPALGDPDAKEADVPRYLARLEDDTLDLFERYVALFTLRNLGASEALAHGLDSDRSSAVLRHELAFVIGQLESEAAVEALSRNVAREDEHVMVRHESAIALGSIGGAAAKRTLRDFSSNEEPMVAESCLVALHMAEYWEAWERLEERLHKEE